AVLEIEETGTGEGDGLAGGWDAEAVAGVGGGAGPADGGLVVLANLVVDADVDAREGAGEAAVLLLERVHGVDGVRLEEADGTGGGKAHLVDDLLAALVPDLFKPALGEGGIGHGALLCGREE